MRRFAVLVFLSCPIVWSSRPVAAAELQIDHVTVAGSNINALLKAFTAATNLPTEYGGKHLNHATEMALASFPDGSYLEFMGIQDQAEPVAVATHVWSKFLKTDAGPCAFALRSRDLSAEITQLKSAGISVKEPERSGRTRPDGMRLEWKTTDIGEGTRGGLFPFFIQDLTPRANRVYLTGKPTTDRFNGISKVVIGVSDLNAAIGKPSRISFAVGLTLTCRPPSPLQFACP